MYQDLLCDAMTGTPARENVVEMTRKEHLSKLRVPPVAFEVSFNSCALCWVRLMTSSIDSCFPLYLMCCYR